MNLSLYEIFNAMLAFAGIFIIGSLVIAAIILFLERDR